MSKAEELLSAIQKISKTLRKIKAKEIENNDLHDFSLANFRYIEEIHNLGNPTFVDLTKQLKLSKPTVTLMVAKLIEKGYVEKTRSEEDGRIFYLSLTEKGEKIVNDYNRIYQKFINNISSKFSDEEMDTLISLLKRM